VTRQKAQSMLGQTTQSMLTDAETKLKQSYDLVSKCKSCNKSEGV